MSSRNPEVARRLGKMANTALGDDSHSFPSGGIDWATGTTHYPKIMQQQRPLPEEGSSSCLYTILKKSDKYEMSQGNSWLSFHGRLIVPQGPGGVVSVNSHPVFI